MMNKKGIEISIGMVVSIIIVIVMFGLGMTLVFRLAGTSDDLSGRISDDTQEAIKQMLSIRGDRIAIPYQTLAVDRGKTALLAVGVQNVLNDQEYVTQVSYDPDEWFIAKSASTFSDCGNACVKVSRSFESSPDLVAAVQAQRVNKNGKYVYSFPIGSRGAKEGTYIFTIDVYYTDYDGDGFSDCYEGGGIIPCEDAIGTPAPQYYPYGTSHTVRVVVD